MPYSSILPTSSFIYCDAGYTDYQAEDNLKEAESFYLQVMKRNSQRADTPCAAYIKQSIRHPIEIVFSSITSRFPKTIHAVTLDGFFLNLATFILVFTLESAFLS